jgi:glycosyltransferase involved in cell wall biosynthesis
MSDSPTFSIIVATYNSEELLENCLNSVFSQTEKDFEVIVIDGASTDKTLDILKNFDKTKENFCFYSEEDNGIYSALNKGINKSKGKWIYVLGSDDELYDHNVLERVKKILHPNLGMVYGNILLRNGLGKKTKILKFKTPEQYKRGIRICPIIFHQAVFLKRDLVLSMNGFDEKYAIHSDHYLMSKIFLSSQSSRIDLIIAKYSTNGFSGITLNNIFKSFKEQIEINKKCNGNILIIYWDIIKNIMSWVFKKIR